MIRVPHGSLDEQLDADALWHLPNALGDPEEQAICRELFSRCHAAGMRTVREVVLGVEGLLPVMRKRLLDGLRRKVGLKTSGGAGRR